MMPKVKLFAMAGLCVALSVAALVAARYSNAKRMRLEQESSGGGQPWRANPDWPPPPPPPEQQQQIDDFPPPPLMMDADEKLIPVDPEARRKGELAIWYADVSDIALQVAWMIPLAGLFFILVLHLISRTSQLETERQEAAQTDDVLSEADKEGESHEPQIDPRLSIPDGAGDSGCGEGS